MLVTWRALKNSRLNFSRSNFTFFLTVPPSLPRATGNTPSRTPASARGQLTRPRLGGSADRITRPRARSVAPGCRLAAGVGEAEEASEGHVQPAEGRAARAKANPGVGELGRHVMPACQESRFIDLQTAATPLWWEHPQATGNPKAPRYTERGAPLARPRAPRPRAHGRASTSLTGRASPASRRSRSMGPHQPNAQGEGFLNFGAVLEGDGWWPSAVPRRGRLESRR